MEKSRSRIPVIHAADLIIDAPRSLPLWVRIRDWTLTLAVWLLYLWLISDVFVFTWRAFEWLFHKQPEPEQLARALPIFVTLRSYAEVIASNAAMLLGWALYNQYRFRGRELRKSSPLVSSDDLSQMYAFPVSAIDQWQAAPILVAHLTDEGRLLKMEIHARPLDAGARIEKRKPEAGP